MLVQERGDDLWLAPLIPANWIEDGRGVAVANAPTRFGPVTYRIEANAKPGYLRAIIESPARHSPSTNGVAPASIGRQEDPIVLVNARPHREFDRARGLISSDAVPRQTGGLGAME